jgi:hypothetical protein
MANDHAGSCLQVYLKNFCFSSFLKMFLFAIDLMGFENSSRLWESLLLDDNHKKPVWKEE